MKTEQPKRPLALIVDDDPDHNKIVSVVLKKLGVAALTTSSAKEFLAKLKEVQPDLCLVDLNIDDLGIGFTIIKAIRKVLGNQLPIMVLSGQSDSKAITHALEVGANDFITKPLDRDILATKLTRYVKTDELLGTQGQLFPVPEGGAAATIELELDIAEVDEFGVKLIGKHLLNKGSVYHLDSALLHRITGLAQPHLLTITSTSLSDEGDAYIAFAEFDIQDKDLMANVRRWLARQ